MPAKHASRLMLVVGLVCVGLSLIPLAITLYFYVSNRRYVDSSAFTRGDVIAQVESRERSSSRNSSYTVVRQRPLIRFRAADGQDVEFVSRIIYAGVGERVPVIYDPQDPARAQAYDFWHIWGFSTFFPAVFFLCFFTVGAGFLFGEWKVSTLRKSPARAANDACPYCGYKKMVVMSGESEVDCPRCRRRSRVMEDGGLMIPPSVMRERRLPK